MTLMTEENCPGPERKTRRVAETRRLGLDTITL